MEKFFVTQITKKSNEDAFAIATTVKDTEKEAKALYHQILSSVYATENMEYAVVKVDNYYGSTLYMDTIIPTEVSEG